MWGYLAVIKRCFVLSVLFGLFLHPAHAQTAFQLDSNRKKVTIPFQFIRNMVVVPVFINSKGPYNFVLDTGVGLMIITDPKLVDSLNVKNKRLIKVSGMGEGKDFEAYMVPSVKVELPGIRGNVATAILKKDEFGLSNYAGMQISGLLGYEFFNSFVVRINFDDSTIVAGLPKDTRAFRRSEKLPLAIEEQKPYVIAQVKLNSKTGKKDDKLILDLGAGHPLSLENLIDENHGLPDKFIASDLGISLTGPISGFLSRIEEIDLGRYKIKDVVASFPVYDSVKTKLLRVNRDGNLGIDLLKKFNMIIDYQNGFLYLKPNTHFHDPFEQDMSGLEYYATGKDYKHIIISNVERGSAGDDIGLQNGDEIVSINFKPVSKMTIQEIDDVFRSRDRRSILLEIFHDKQYDKVIIILKKRI
jgi:hypothetical protein